MTHEFVGVIVTPDVNRSNAQPVIEKILEPFREEWNERTKEFTGWWDFWSIGGRWTGVWVDGYEPHKDPRNRGDRRCFICGGSGHRPDIGEWDRAEYIKRFGGCNGCQGSGWYPPHPSAYVPMGQDVLPVAEFLTNEALRAPRRLVLPDSGVICRDDFDGEYIWDPSPEWSRHVRNQLAPFAAASLVAVDVHV